MAPEVRKYIWDAKEAAARALRFTAGKSLDDYLTTSCYVRLSSASS